jgi:hypothetical protein
VEGSCENCNKPSGHIKCGILGVAGRLEASREGLSFMELVSLQTYNETSKHIMSAECG